MKTLQIRVSDEEHTAIKVEAARLGLSIKEFVLNGRVTAKVREAPRDIIEPQQDRSAEPSDAPKELSYEPIEEPIMEPPKTRKEAVVGSPKPTLFKKGGKK